VQLTGEVGTGKTTLCRAVLQSLDRRAFASYVPDPVLSREDLLKTLLIDFGVTSLEDVRAGRLRGATRTDLSYPLYDFLAALQPLKAFAVVMIDEAHKLTTELLEEIRILSDLENGQKLLEVLLIGQPELQARLNQPEMRQLGQRVTMRYNLSPLTTEEVQPYVAHRLAIAGNDGRVHFPADAIDLVFAASGGIPRVINVICDRALLRAAASRTDLITADHVLWAVADLQLHEAPPGAAAAGITSTAVSAGAPMESVAESVAKFESPSAAAEIVSSAEPRVHSGRTRWITIACSGLAATLAIAGYLAFTAQSQPPASTVPGVAAAAVAPVDPAAPIPAQKLPPAAAPADDVEKTTGSIGSSRVLLLMATFDDAPRADQALQELRDAGFRGYTREVPLRDGGSAFVVFLGPYGNREDAARDLERARQIPGYDSGRIVEPPAARRPS
jgi:general secretion pathway protein A